MEATEQAGCSVGALAGTESATTAEELVGGCVAAP